MLSGNTTLGAVLQAINAGQVFRLLLKPCSHDDLAQNIHQALEQKMLMDRCRHVLHMFKRQNDFIQDLKSQHPEIFQSSELDPKISYGVDADRSVSPESMISEINAEIQRASGMHKAIRIESEDSDH